MRSKATLLAFAAAFPGHALAAPTTFEATISRTEFNIPHIRSDSWGGVGYGVGYAYAQDNVCMLAEEFATIEGTRSLHFGPEGRSALGFNEVDNLTSDLFYRSQIDLARLRAGWPGQSAASRALVDGYVAGYNRYLRDTGAANLPAACRSKDWVRPITRDDLLRLNEKQMLLASSLALAPGLALAAPPGTAPAPKVSFAFPLHEDLKLGSNGWAFGGDATADGRGLVIGNPHFPWEGPARFWQMHVMGPEGYDVMGVGIAGTPIPTLGFNRDVAWTHTVTAARHFTLYALTLAPDDPTTYIVDGAPVKMQARIVSVPMPDGAAPVERTLYSTRFGPVVVQPGGPLQWTTQTAYALRDANTGNQRAIEAWLRIGQAKTVGAIQSAVSETLGIPWVNTIAADRAGDALHADVTAVPGVSAEFIAGCATPFTGLVAQLVTLLDGSRAACDWRTGVVGSKDGLLPASDQAARIRRDYVTNSNDSYWISNPREPYRQLSPILGDFERPLSLRTRSNYLETEALIASTKVDHAAAKALLFGNKSLAGDMALEPLIALCAPEETLAAACSALAKWDRRFETDSRGAYLFAVFWEKVREQRGLWQVPFDPQNPVNTPHTLVTDDATAARLRTALGEAAGELAAAGIALDAPWGEVLARRLGERQIALHGGPGTAGVLNVQHGREVASGLAPRHGSSYIQIVGFDAQGPVAEAILSYAQSTDPASPHYADQTELYSQKRWHRLPFAADEIEAQRTGEAVTISE
jgi:acyl-homoserine-lactone acylase